MRKMLTIAAIVTTVVIAVGGVGLVVSRRPVLLQFTAPGEIVRPTFAVFNPLRDRGPEAVAEAVLNQLLRGDVESAMARVHTSNASEIADKERRYRLRRWQLVNRTDDPQGVTLYYRTNRGVSSQLDSDVVFWLQRDARSWRISDYRPMY